MTAYGSLLTAGYTGDSLRAWKQTAAGRAYFLYDGAEPVIELNNSGTVTAVNTFGADGLLSRHTSAGSVFYAFDPEGNVTQRLDASQNVLSTFVFDAFGMELAGGNTGDPWGYGAQAGYFTDGETGLILCTHRYYDPSAGRWLNRDPIGTTGGVNLYAYVANAPSRAMDPSGFGEDSVSASIEHACAEAICDPEAAYEQLDTIEEAVSPNPSPRLTNALDRVRDMRNGAREFKGIKENPLNKMMGNEQRQLINQYFKSGGSNCPKGLTRQTLRIYRELARQAINNGKDVKLGVQACRLNWIQNTLWPMPK